MDTGYVWVPYVSNFVLSITRTEPGENDDIRINILRNRCATTTVNQNYYSTVTIDTDVQSLYGEIINLRNNE